MTLTIKLVALVAFATLSASLPVKVLLIGQSQEHLSPPPQSTLTPDSYSPDSYASYQPQLPLSLELPRAEQNPVNFFEPEPVTYLKAPKESSEPDFYQVPIPDQELVAPVDTEWNPENDPKFYYAVPAIITKQELPTQEFPKKFNKDIHQKDKPYSSKPKQEVVLEPIDPKQYEDKQKQLDKTLEKLAKKENQKDIKMLLPRNKRLPIDSVPKYSDHIPSATTYDQGLSAEIIDSLGIPTNAASHESPHGERLEFHMVGHAGPHSYKWGYDTGKGPNRLFRFEERDNEGVVKGHYGFYDKEGKLQVIHYDAHPHLGFHVSENS